jgi:hypothetical protein
MKAKFLILLSLFSLQLAISQNYQTVEEVNDACATLGFKGDEDAEIAVDDILSQIGLFRNFTIQECPDINNAIAKNIDVGDGKKARYILYDKEFFNRIEDKAANDWAATSVLAHEVGHHLNGHALNDEGSNHKWELEADEFSGFVLARMGSTLQDAQSAISTFKYEKATRTHPAKADRLLAIEIGWNRGSGKIITVPEMSLEDITVIEDEPIEENTSKIAAQQVLANYLEVIGGQEKILKIKSLYQEVEYTTSTEGNPPTLYSTINQKRTMMTPNSTYIESYMADYPASYSLVLNGNSYYKIKKDEEWKFATYNDAVESKPSFIEQYGILVTNQNLAYLGKEVIAGVECHAIEIPDFNLNSENEQHTIKSNSKRLQYYNVETRLLQFEKTLSRTILQYKENAENLIGSDKTLEGLSSYFDYQEVDGVLFPFKIEMKSMGADAAVVATTILDYKTIRANPEISPTDFRVKK